MPGKGVTMLNKGKKPKMGVTMLPSRKGAPTSPKKVKKSKPSDLGSGAAMKASEAIVNRHKIIKEI